MRWDRLYGCAGAEAVVRATTRNLALVVADNMTDALNWESECSFFANDNLPVRLFQDWETLPYDVFSPHQGITAARLSALAQMRQQPHGIIIIAADTLMQQLPPVDFIMSRSLFLAVNTEIDRNQLLCHLDACGYRPATQVSEHGEYAMRGSLLDVFTPGSTTAIRIDFLDDVIDSLRWFDPETQTSTGTTDSVNILPAREFPLDKESIGRFRQRFRTLIHSSAEESLVYRSVSEGNLPGGIEYYMPLFFRNSASFFDYLPDSAVLFTSDGTDDYCVKHWHNILQRFDQSRANIAYPPLDPQYLFLSPEKLALARQNFRQVILSSFKNIRQAYNGNTHMLPAVSLQDDAERPAANLTKLLNRVNGRALVVAESPGYREQLSDTLALQGIHLKTIKGWQHFMRTHDTPCICVGQLHNGALFGDTEFAVIPDHQIIKRKARQKQRRLSSINPVLLFENLGELTTGCPVVHEKYGVGRYHGLETLNIGDVPAEFLVLNYADDEKLYVPISSLNLVTRYTGGSPDTAPLHTLGGEQWRNTKRRAARKAFDVAAELLDAQARRSRTKGMKYAIDKSGYLNFSEKFPFEETPDQARTIMEILRDMNSDTPMDRVVCGDVGFGKTEIAMRAAFIAAQNGHQTAVLVPTTLLASQHSRNFRDRFADWPIRIEMLSRFLTSLEQKRVRQRIRDGTADIIIGTHKLLQHCTTFKRLGLIVIDEEHRFGVRHKETLKSRHVNCDILTLSATPIPRTLNMSLSGLRDLSIIATPPPGRFAIKTFVHEWNDELIRESCQRELRRGGQVYFLHNDINTIEDIVKKLLKLLPDATIRSAHGKMPERELESIMLDFYHRRINILVCTTIIESGLDIPTANSIIINAADKLGLSQLHQLRGRVGRSHHRAYAYLLTSAPRAGLPRDAVKRLEAVESLEELGTGFVLASQDLEIRGAGELLGDGQSGHIHEIGFALYNKMLRRAIDALRSGTLPDTEQPLNTITEVNFGAPAIIPHDYVPDINLRLIMYRRIAAAKSEDNLAMLQREMIDRFGKLPPYLKNFFTNAFLRLDCCAAGIRKINADSRSIRLEFNANPEVNFAHLLDLIQKKPETYRLHGSNQLIVRQSLPKLQDRVDATRNLLKEITCVEAA